MPGRVTQGSDKVGQLFGSSDITGEQDDAADAPFRQPARRLIRSAIIHVPVNHQIRLTHRGDRDLADQRA